MAIAVSMPRKPAAVLKALYRDLDNLDAATVTAKQLIVILDEHRSSL